MPHNWSMLVIRIAAKDVSWGMGGGSKEFFFEAFSNPVGLLHHRSHLHTPRASWWSSAPARHLFVIALSARGTQCTDIPLSCFACSLFCTHAQGASALLCCEHQKVGKIWHDH